ncbi:mucin-2 [Musca domestica]|uniref:Mucin-2 n=1 Tax=Musca domestica TaxID=7370 RepID=A0A9J7HZX0_MUSDO|nr:mucin-2 [Musca domestica]
MDTVYGTKKYFQSLSGASDIYRSPACRAVSNDYTYQNTLGRRSTLGAYYHMNNQPSYSTDNLNTQYGYNSSWGIWRDGRNLAPSTFSAKPHLHYQKTRSFSIILTTAAFIVLLAVISIAGLAFYFSSIKGNMEDPVLGFEGTFRIAKGDMFSTGLKYNHTASYKQKIEFYKRFVDRALMDQGLQPMRTDVWGFGEGPLIKVNFRAFFDVRKLPQNIHNVEEYIKEAIFLETTTAKSLYKTLRIDSDSVEVKRILDEQVVKSASLFKDAHTVPTSQTQLEKRLMKKGGSPPALINKPSGKSRPTPKPHSPDDEPDVDVENAPVIQGSFEGSFEITKTDADISQRKKTTPTRAYGHSSSLAPKTVTPYALRVKPKKPGIEKLTTIMPQSLPATSRMTTTSSSSTTTTTTSTTTTTTTTTPAPTTRSTTTTTTTTARPTTTTSKPTTSTTPSTTTTTSSTSTTAKPTTTTTRLPTSSVPLNHFTYPSIISSSHPPQMLPKLDQNLFTSVPVLDTQPWRPIHREVPEFLPGPPPSFPTKTLPSVLQSTPLPPIAINEEPPRRRIDEIELPFLPEEPRPPKPALDPYTPNFFGPAYRKPEMSSETKNPHDMMFYHSFGNPVFMPASESIERLGVGSSVQPHPLPVPLIDDVVIPPFKPLTPGLTSQNKLPFEIPNANDKFEHLGDGILAKKPENMTQNSNESIDMPTTTTSTTTTTPATIVPTKAKEQFEPTIKPIQDEMDSSSVTSELADKIGEFFMDWLDLPKDEVKPKQEQPLESRIEPEEDSFTVSSKETELESASSELSSTTNSIAEEESSTTTYSTSTSPGKPNFLNLKELILKRNQLSNQRKSSDSTTPVISSTVTTAKPTTSTTTTTTTTTLAPITTTTPKASTVTTKRIKYHPSNSKPPTMLDDSNLFPSHSKWEFVNSSAANHFGHTGNMRKVFNTTLQAWVSEDVEKTEKTESETLDDIKTKINNASNIQDISFIFDTLASKLGITTSLPTKEPPFSHNKLKQSQKNESRTKATTTTTMRTTPTTSTTIPTTTTTTSKRPITTTPPVLSVASEEDDLLALEMRREPFIKPMSSFIDDTSAEGVGAAIPVVGEAEVEVIDPTKYEEMLKSSHFADATTTETTPKLVTLLPVRSNSGIRTYRPLVDTGRSSSSSSSPNESTQATNANPTTTTKKLPTSRPSITRRKNVNQSRRFPPAEAVIRGGLKVTVK